ncbi:MAG: hypothetical protein WA063_06510 [Minisyncoccia bacterium]
MPSIELPIGKKLKILSLGAESVGRFCFYNNGEIFISRDFGDILDINNFDKYKKAVLRYIKSHEPGLILTDMHPLYHSTVLGEELSGKLKVPQIKIQHHFSHIFSAIGDRIMLDAEYSIPDSFFGIAMDGTGYGLDGNIWGGEVFKCQMSNVKCQMLRIERIGSLEEQILIGGDLAVKEPARMILAILAKIPNDKFQISNKSQMTNSKYQKDFVYKYVKKYYSRNEFEALYSQLEQNFNCQTTTSAGRILDAVSVLLGFADNKRDFKHEAAKMLEKNSSIPYDNTESRIMNQESRKILNTTYLFEYLLKNIRRDKKRLAATAQLYLAKGLYGIIKEAKLPIGSLASNTKRASSAFFAAGGMANNMIISSYLKKRGVYLSKKIPRGDEGLAFGQIIYYLLMQ